MDNSSLVTIQRQKDSYQKTLFTTTLYGAWIGAAFEIFFAGLYWLMDMPSITVWMNLGAMLLSLVALAILRKSGRQKPAACLVSTGIYLSLIGPALFTGGIDSSSVYWLIFLPVVAALMGGKKSSLAWSIIGMATAAGLYLLNRVLGIDFSVYQPQSSDRIIDISAALLATAIASWLNEWTKLRMMGQLEEVQGSLENLADRDPLTGIFNRRYFYTNARSILTGQPCEGERVASLLMIDIDEFKLLNDRYGHLVGDEIIRGFTDLCRKIVRERDLVTRFGGEEFVILLPCTDLENALSMAERLRAGVEAAAFQTAHGAMRITISIGVINRKITDIQSLEHFVDLADLAMYQAKRAGRNQVSLAEEKMI